MAATSFRLSCPEMSVSGAVSYGDGEAEAIERWIIPSEPEEAAQARLSQGLSQGKAASDRGEKYMTLTMTAKPVDRRSDSQWPAGIRKEFELEAQNPNGCVGQQLVAETDKVRVWRIHLKPGQRVGFHRHVLDYFWSAATAGRGRQYFNDGEMREYTYAAGETRQETYGLGEYKVHDLQNVGETDLTFVTVEFLDSANMPLSIPQAVRDQIAA